MRRYQPTRAFDRAGDQYFSQFCHQQRERIKAKLKQIPDVGPQRKRYAREYDVHEELPILKQKNAWGENV